MIRRHAAAALRHEMLLMRYAIFAAIRFLIYLRHYLKPRRQPRLADA